MPLPRPTQTLIRGIVLASGVALSAAPAQAERTVTGTLTYLARIALPPDALVVTALRDGFGTTLAEARYATDGAQVPLPFTLTAPGDTETTLSAAIFSGGLPIWQLPPTAIAAGAGPADMAMLKLVPFRATGLSATFRCGETDLDLAAGPDMARLRIGAEFLDLRHEPAASGAKYVLPGDAGTFAWSKGNAMTVSLRGKTLAECEPRLPDPGPFRARGNEPGWSLELTGDMLSYTGDFGATTISAPLPEGKADPASPGTRQFDLPGSGIAVTVEAALCRDDATGMLHPYRVSVTTGGRTLSGCGGAPDALLTGVTWRVEDIDRAGIIDNAEVTLRFADGRVFGSGGCNRYNGGYEIGGEGLRFGPAASGMMMCPDALMNLEMSFHKALAGVDRFDISDTGALLLIAADRAIVTARPAN